METNFYRKIKQGAKIKGAKNDDEGNEAEKD